jgi:hypothetical protein
MNRPSDHRRKPIQISLGFMMLMMVIFAAVSAGFFYASRVPAIQNEISGMLGGEVGSQEDVGRGAQILFIMFTFTSPLILAGLLSTGVAIVRRFSKAT